MTDTPRQIVEDSFRIAFDYLQGIGELGDVETAMGFLLDSIESQMKRGEHRKLMLANRAIDAYRERRTKLKLALVS